MDRRTDRLDGSGRGSPTVVTSRATGDDLIGGEQDAQPNGVTAPSRNGIEGAKDASANGRPAATAKDTGLSAADATVATGMPALPADTIGASRSSRPNGPDPDRERSPRKVAEQPPADDSPAFSFGPPSSAPVGLAEAAADPAESAAKPWGADAAPSRTVPPGPGRSGGAPSGRPASSVPPALADPPSASAAAFAWEMPDSASESPSSPAPMFLRSGTSAESSAAPKAASPACPGTAGAGKTAAGEGPVTVRNPAQKGKSKRTARQAHLTVARVEPWSVMKFSFVVSLVAFVILFVAVSVLYGVLSSLGVFDSLQRVVQSVTSSQTSAGVNAKAWFSASKVLGYTALLGSLNIVLITAMATIGSVVYNLTSRLVGGVEVTLRETE